jgi:hypothetical protein
MDRALAEDIGTEDTMPKTRSDRPLRAVAQIDAAPSAVWQVVSDLRRTGEWSPECSRVVPVGKVRRGSWLLGFNRRRLIRWMTVSRILSFEPEHEISWKVLTNGAIWTYRLEPVRDGTKVTETRDTPNGVGGFARAFTRVLLGGQSVHDDELETGMSLGLERIKNALAD